MALTVVKPVRVKLKSVIDTYDGQPETIEMDIEGQLRQNKDTHYIRYIDEQEEGQITTIIKMTQDRAIITRSGAVTMRLPLQKDVIEQGQYENKLGKLPLDVRAQVLHHHQAHGEFHTTYELLMGGQALGLYTLTIQYSEVGK